MFQPATKKLHKCEQGVVAFEAAITLPLLFLLLLGMVEIALLYQKQMQLDFACFRATRAAIVFFNDNFNDKTNEEDWLKSSEKSAQRSTQKSMSSRLSLQSLLSLQQMKLTWLNETEVMPIAKPIHLGLEFPASFKFFPLSQNFNLKSQCVLNNESIGSKDYDSKTTISSK